MKKAGIIICVYNRIEFIEKCITSVLSLDFDDYELIIVDDGSNDGTYEVCKKFEQDDNVRIHRNEKNLGLMKSRNIGAELADAEIVTFVDSDSTPERTWLKEIIKPFDLDKKIAVTGGEISDGPAKGYWSMACKGLFKLGSKSGYTNGIFGGNMAVRKKVLLDYKFDETLKYGADEKDLGIRLQKGGFKIYFQKQAKVIHFPRTSFKSVIKQRFLTGRANCYCNLKNKMFPFLYIKSFLLLFILGGMFFASGRLRIFIISFLAIAFILLTFIAEIRKKEKNIKELVLSLPGNVLMAMVESLGDIYGVFNFSIVCYPRAIRHSRASGNL
jgi:glycosyltransferase involved in cell wall biosynthesis